MIAAAALGLLAIVSMVDPSPRSRAACDAAVRAEPRSFAAWNCYVRLAWVKHDWRPSAARLEAVLAHDPRNPRAQLYLGVLLNDKGGDRSERLFRAAAAGFAAEGELGGEARARIFLHATLCDDGRCDEAAFDEARADALVSQVDDRNLAAIARYFKGAQAWREGDLGRALGHYQAARAASDVSWWSAHRALDGLAEVYSALGRHREAYEAYREEVDLLAGEPYFQALARGGLAAAAVRLAEAEELPQAEADRLIAEALSAQERAGVRHYIREGEGSTRLLYARRLGATEAGIAQARQALAVGDQDRHAPLQIAARRLLARLLAERDSGHPAEPLRLLAESIARALQVGSRSEAARGLLVRAWVQRREGARAQFIQDALGALEELDRLRELQPEPTLRASSASEHASAYQLVGGWLLDPSRGPPDLPLGFATMERMRARVLREQLEAEKTHPPPSPLQGERASTLASITRVQRRLLREGLQADRSALLAELQRLERRDEALRDELARQAAGGQRAQLTPTLREVQDALADDQAMLLFQTWSPLGAEVPLEDGSSWALLVERGQAQAFRIPDAPRLQRSVRVLSALIERRDQAESAGAARLHRELLAAPLAALSSAVRRLVIVPDGPLHRLAFDALRVAEGSPPLPALLRVSLAPSAALWLRWQRSPPAPAAAPVLALADPESRESASTLGLSALPHGRAEAAFAVAHLGSGSRLEVGARASERLLKTEDLRSFGVLHIAAHALVDDDHPERSAVLLAPGGQDEDGLLQLREVAALDLSGRLVVLGACRSSTGAILLGEGALSLSRAFFQAGAQAVVGALWEVRDDEASALLTAFYRHLAEGRSVAEAMQRARLDRVREGAPAAAWAGFTVLGDGDLVPWRARTRPWGRAAAAGVVAVAVASFGLALLWLRRVHRRGVRERFRDRRSPYGRHAGPDCSEDR